MVLNGLTRCCVAFNSEYSDKLYEIFVDRLARFTPDQVGSAFASAIDECERMPRIKHILARIEQPKSSQQTLDVKIAGIHREYFDEKSDLKVWTSDLGARFVRVVPRDPFALPPKVETRMSEADQRNFQQQMKAAAKHMKVPYLAYLSEAEIERRRQEQLNKLAEHLKAKSAGK